MREPQWSQNVGDMKVCGLKRCGISILKRSRSNWKNWKRKILEDLFYKHDLWHLQLCWPNWRRNQSICPKASHDISCARPSGKLMEERERERENIRIIWFKVCIDWKLKNANNILGSSTLSLLNALYKLFLDAWVYSLVDFSWTNLYKGLHRSLHITPTKIS